MIRIVKTNIDTNVINSFYKTKLPIGYKMTQQYIVVYCVYYTKIYSFNPFIYIIWIFCWKYCNYNIIIRDILV